MKKLSELNQTINEETSNNSISSLIKEWCEESSNNIEYKSEKEIKEIYNELSLIFNNSWTYIGNKLLDRLENDKMQTLDKTKTKKRIKTLTDFYEFLSKNFS